MSENSRSAKHPDKPLGGQRILVTRPSEFPCKLTNLIENAGGKVLLHPVIEMASVDDPKVLDSAISRLPAFQWIVFVSPAGVRFFCERLKSLGCGMQQLHHLKFAAIGKSTAGCLKETANVNADLIPCNSSSGFLAEALVGAGIVGKLLVIRANRGSDELGRRLTEAKVEFEEVAAYQSRDITFADPAIVNQLQNGDIDWVTITSSAVARSTIGLFQESLRGSKLASISPTTTQAVEALGGSPDCEAKQYNFAGLVRAIMEATS